MAQPTIQSGSIATYIGFYSSGNPTRTISVTVGAGTNRTIFCAIAFQQGSTLTVPAGFTITYGGTAMTLVGSYGTGSNSCAVLYKLDDPAVGTASLVVGNPSASVLTSFTLAAFVADGLNGSGRTSALINTSAAAGVATPKNVSITATSDDITLYLVATNKSDVAAASGQTALLATSLIGIDTQYCNFSYKLGASSSVGSTWATGTAQLADSAIVLKGTLTVTGDINVTTDPAVFSGSAGPGNSSQAAATVTTEAALFAGSAGTVAANLTTSPFKNNTGSVLAGLSGLTVAVIRMTDFALAGVFTGQTTNGSGVLTINSTAIAVGVEYAVMTRNAAGVLGVEKYTATS